MANFLEVIRYNYALNVGVATGIFAQSGDSFECVGGLQSGKRATFMEILQRFCAAVGLTGWSKDFKDVRNEIIHTGALQGPLAIQIQRYLDLGSVKE